MKILMTGATGFIGKEIGKELVKRGHSLRVMSRNVPRARQILPFPAEIISGRNGLPQGALDGIDAVINLAGESLAERRWTESQKAKIRDSRIKITSDLMRLVRGSNVKAVISTSAIGFYGDRDGEELTEDSGPGSGFLAEVCRAWEAELFEGVQGMKDPPRIAAIRLGMVLGPRGGALEKLLPVFRAGIGGPLGSGEQFVSWIHLDDAVRLFCFAVESENVEGILNGVTPNPITNLEFAKVLGKVLDKSASIGAPEFAVKLAMGEMSTVVLSSQKVNPVRPLRLGFQFQHPHLEEALKSLVIEVDSNDLVFEQYIPAKKEDVTAYFQAHPEVVNPIKAKGSWAHVPSLEPMGAGTLLKDRVIFDPKKNWITHIGASLLSSGDIKKAFKQRRRALDQKFSA